MVDKKSWDEFQKTGLILYINQILHVFGWAIVVEREDGSDEIKSIYPARVKFRGFDNNSVSKAYIKISNWLKHNINELDDEANDRPEKKE